MREFGFYGTDRCVSICPFQRGLRRQPAPELRGHRGLGEARQGQRTSAGTPVARHRQGGGVQGTEGTAGGVVGRRTGAHTGRDALVNRV